MKKIIFLIFAWVNIFILCSQDFLMNKYFNYDSLSYNCYFMEQLPLYKGTNVHHLISLPENYNGSKKWPVIFELTGNKWEFGNGTVEEAHFGLSISLKRDFIVVVLPYIAKGGKCNQSLWWGDIELTVSYIKEIVPFLEEKYRIDKKNLFLCGFSRGSIGVSFLGLYDDEIASIWKGFISHDHFDGFKEWNTDWGRPLKFYRENAIRRLKRLNGRHWYVSYNIDQNSPYDIYLKDMKVFNYAKFEISPISISKMFDMIPNDYFKSPHNDIWPAFNTREGEKLRTWLYELVKL